MEKQKKYFVRKNGDSRFYGTKEECEDYIRRNEGILKGHLWNQPEPVITIDEDDIDPFDIPRYWDEF